MLVLVLVFAASRLYQHQEVQTSTPIPALSNQLVQKHSGPEMSYPRSDLTPGAVDPTVTQENIYSTICVPGYTKMVRPPERITRRLKIQIMQSYGNDGDFRDFELDHFIPLELGGCPDCIANLWPEEYDMEFGARRKDIVENYLHRQVCSGKISLKEAQIQITTDWVNVFEHTHLSQTD